MPAESSLYFFGGTLWLVVLVTCLVVAVKAPGGDL